MHFLEGAVARPRASDSAAALPAAPRSSRSRTAAAVPAAIFAKTSARACISMLEI
jgi:hypothetical protein